MEQAQAISQKGCNLLVAAAAGAGKTAVLVERIIRKITDPEKPVDLDRLLVVTFTNAAATEMRERVGRALEEALEKEPSSLLLQKQMSLLDRASIMTIHSFCLEAVPCTCIRTCGIEHEAELPYVIIYGSSIGCKSCGRGSY